MTTPAPIRFGREVVSDLAASERLEWLVTNGIGGYGSGTVAGSISRGYHGLLVAAAQPPVDRRIMLVKLDETLSYLGLEFELATNRWASGAIAPNGCSNVESFSLEGSVPVWRYACADSVLDKRVWMRDGANTTYVSYSLIAASEPVQLSIRAIVDNRVFHNTGQVAWPVTVTPVAGAAAGLRVDSGIPGSVALTMLADSGSAVAVGERYDGYSLPAEADRGLNDIDTHVHAGTFTATLNVGETLTFLGSAEDHVTIEPQQLQERRQRDADLLHTWQAGQPAGTEPAPAWVCRLVLAADQFIVARATPDQPDGRSVIAGYHWFEDWGRDTMISLPGLTLATGRPKIAAGILRAFAQFVDQGMLPNRFPDAGTSPAYNTIDATLWYFLAVRAYVETTGDDDLLRSLWPTLQSIVEWHFKGTRYGIKVDPIDGLLSGGQAGVQLTWMDAIVDGRVITPRIGKPIEVNALWFNALRAMVLFGTRLGKPVDDYELHAESAATGFARFWNPSTGYCYDVLDGPDGDETSLRPNQLIAISLPEPLLDATQQQAVLASCLRALLTSRGLRSLAPDDPAFVGTYGGDQAHRDGAYHQGTVWGWLIGPLVAAHLRVHGDAEAALNLLAPFGDHLAAAGLGTVSEIHDGDAPFNPQGCIAQAWSVAEALRAYRLIERARLSAQAPDSGKPKKARKAASTQKTPATS
jgi:predicted glycogen debranching enzyme